MTDTLRRALWFANGGCSVIPIDHPAETIQTDPKKIGKVPIVAWTPFQTTQPTDGQLQEWFGNSHRRNIGIVTGAISNLVVIDCDSPEAVAWADRNLPSTPWRSRTSKGEHRGYRHPGIHIQNKVGITTGDRAIKIDVRGDGGYAVAPGSEHQSGARYEWVGEPPSMDALPVFDPAWLAVDTPDAKDEKPTPIPPSIPHGQQNDTLFREGCRLRERGWGEAEIADALWSLHLHRSEGTNVPNERKDIDTIARGICAQYKAGGDLAGSRQMDLICAAEVQVVKLKWLYYARLAHGAITLVEGGPEKGKSTILCDFAARVSRGHSFPAETETREPGNVVMLIAEDDIATTVVPRLMAAGADLEPRTHSVRCTLSTR
jgi:hypothetical protein